MFEGQPKGLFALALANTGERFGYYTMIAVFALFLRANYGLSPAVAGAIYSSFLMVVYFLPLIGGWMADKFGYGKMVTIGIIIAVCDDRCATAHRLGYRSVQGQPASDGGQSV